MGFITMFLSEALVSGYTCAASFAILTTQISSLLGLDRMAAAVDPGPFDTPRVSHNTYISHIASYQRKLCIALL